MANGDLSVESGRVVLHVSPHPDDETLGAGPVLATMAHAGWRVVNLACGLGRPDDHERRGKELAAALADLGFVDERVEPPAAISRGDDLDAARTLLAGEIAAAVERHRPAVVVSPQPHDDHPGHEVVARAVLDALGARAAEDPAAVPRWWMWGFWRDLASPTLLVPFGALILSRVDRAVMAYEGELARNDYARLPVARGTVGSIQGWERVFGYGSTRDARAPYADLLTEAVWADGGWRLGSPRVLDPADPFAAPSQMSLGPWLGAD